MARKAKEPSGGRLTRSDTVTIRLDPRLNYLCEIAARVQRRTKSSFIEAAIDEAVHRIPLEPRGNPQYTTTVGEDADRLWHVRAHERLIALAQIAPHLMTMDEQEIWAVICEYGFFWRGKWVNEGLEEFGHGSANPPNLSPNVLPKAGTRSWRSLKGRQKQLFYPSTKNVAQPKSHSRHPQCPDVSQNSPARQFGCLSPINRSPNTESPSAATHRAMGFTRSTSWWIAVASIVL